MKKSLLVVFVLSTMFAQAQDFKSFKVNLSAGYAQATGKGISGGALFSIEPKISLSSQVDLGLRLEEALLIRGVNWDGNGSTSTGTVAGFGSALLTATHLFGTTNTRPFLGVGLGLYSIASSGTVLINNGQVKSELPLTSYTTIGGMIRAGVKLGHFVAAAEYNAIPTHTYKLPTVTTDFTTKSSYFGFKIGFDLGGGRRSSTEQHVRSQF